MVLQISHHFGKLLQQIIALCGLFSSRSPLNKPGKESFAGQREKSATVPILLFVERVGGKVASPVEPTVVVPDGENILIAVLDILDRIEDLLHEDLEVLGGVSIEGNNPVAGVDGELLHNGLDDGVGVVVELLEVVAKVPQDVAAPEDALQELILLLHVVDVLLFGAAHGGFLMHQELVFEPVDRPSNVGRQGPINLPIRGARPPNELSLVLKQYVLVGSLDQESLNANVGQDSQGGLRMPKGVC